MPILAAGIGLLALLAGLALATAIGTRLVERRFPPAGRMLEIHGAKLHVVHVPAAGPDLPPTVFLHGASGNLLDQMRPIRGLLEGRSELLFLDRPGHGWSDRGSDPTLDGQADLLAATMDRLGVAEATVVGHSFGGALAATVALRHPEKVRALLFLAPATHPWPGGRTAWYYVLAALPVLGRLFVHTVALPAAWWRMRAATVGVFAPNPVPPGYAEAAAIPLVLRPAHFRANAIDVAGLFAHVTRVAPLYPTIAVPAVIVTGDSDGVVYEHIHSAGLARDIAGSRLVRIRGLGHKPDWIAPDLTLAALETLAGMPRDLEALARKVESRIMSEPRPAASAVLGGGGELAPAD